MSGRVRFNVGPNLGVWRRRDFRRACFFVLLLFILILLMLFWVRKRFLYDLIEESLRVEVGSAVPEANEFLTDRQDQIDIAFGADIENIDMNQLGEYPVTLEAFDREWESLLIVEDTVPPRGEVTDGVVPLDGTCSADSLVVSIEDKTEVTCSFKEQPDLSEEGFVDVTVVLTDAGGNTTELPTWVRVIADEEAPVIDGVGPLTGFLDEPISYKAAVTVTDNCDEDVQLEVDTSHVNVNEPGKYTVLYTATDWAGNTAREATTITISEKPENFVEESVVLEMAQEILDEITTEDMTVKEVAWAIFDWTYNSIAFTDTSEKDSWTNGAYQGFTLRSGDCFIYFSTAKALLTQAGIPNIDIERSDTSRAHHYWNLVNCGDGWYHFDTCRFASGYQTFMHTDEQVAEFTASYGYHDYYVFDHSLYPATPTELFSMDD